MGIRRTSAIATCAVLISALTALPADPAFGCSGSTHCYGDDLSNVTGVKGVAVTIDPSCLSTPSGGSVSDETWLIDAHSGIPYWVEVGYLQLGAGASSGTSPYVITGPGRFAFWEDYRPGHTDIDGHVLQNNPSLTAGAFASISANGGGTWRVAFNGYGSNSTSNYMVPTAIEVGSESNTAASKSYSFAYGAEYLNSGGTWTSGMASPTAPVQNSPERFTWVSKSTSYDAGITC